MIDGINSGSAAPDSLMIQLQAAFEKMPNEIEIYLFTSKRKDDVFSESARKVIRSFRELTPKIKLKEHDLNHQLAQAWKVENAPTMVFNPDTHSIRWLGAPVGEEGRTFLELILLLGFGDANLSDASKKVIAKIDSSRDVKIFVSPTCPYCPQQSVNGIRAAIEKPDLISLELIDIQCNPEIAQHYHAHSVPQTYSDDILIGNGAQSEELFMLSLQTLQEQKLFIPDVEDEMIETDLLIVGGGPAGLTAGIYAERSGLKTGIVERNALGGQVATTPVVENYPGFTSVGGKALVDIMVNHALEYVQIFQGEEVLDIVPGEIIEVSTSRRKVKTRAVLLATGAAHRHLGVPGETRLSGRGVSYCSTCDGPLFKGKKVVMVGGGNSAVTEALYLNHMGVSVTLIHRRDTLRAQDALIRNLEQSNIPILWNTEIKEIKGRERVTELELANNQTGKTSSFQADGVFISIGYEPAVELARKIGLELTEEGYIKRDDKHRTSIAGIYSAGDVEGGYKQIVTAAGQGAEAAMSIFEDLINPYWKTKKLHA